MLRIDIAGTVYDMPNDWSDITMRQLLESQKLIPNMPDKMKAILFPEKGKEVPEILKADEQGILDFTLKWFKFWVDCPNAHQINVADLKAAFDILTMFMYTPKDMEYDDHISFKGVDYYLPETEKLVSGRVKHMANSTYEEWVEGAQLTSQLSRMEQGDLSVLPILTATFYRPRKRTLRNFMRATVESYDEEKVAARAELFMDLPMNVVWGSYFFLAMHLEKYVNGLQTSLKETVVEAQRQKDTVGT